MSAPSPSGAGTNSSRNEAMMLAGLGYKIIPLPPGEKYPKGIPEWQKKATCDVLQIERWFEAFPDSGLGWAMGTQPNGVNLAGIDVDVANGKQGWASLRQLDVRFDLKPMLRNTTTSVTGSDGRHLIVDTGPIVVTNGKLGPGLDLRGEGGFLVAPPSIHPNGNRYRWIDGKAPWETPPFHVEQRFAEYLSIGEAGVVPPSPPRSTGGMGSRSEDSPADWCRANIRIGDLLIEGGWTYSHSQGGDHYWTRPDKSVKDGHSAVLHDDAPLVVWSTTCPASFWRAGKSARDGSRVLSPLEVLAAVRYSGDVRAASSAVRKMMPKDGRASGGEAVIPEAAAPQLPDGPALMGGGTTPGLNLPDDFWTSRDLLAHIRQGAHARLVSPDATLIGVLARFAAVVPPSYRLPALVGSEATFDFIGCSVASSSGGKTVANYVAADLLPIERSDVLMDLPVGSGEGLIQSFMVEEIGDDGKKTGRQIVGKTAVHFQVDEGTALMEQQARKGTTIVQTLCSAWSGSTLGQANASAETRRIIEAKRVRVAAVINIQTANGHLLLDERMTAVGLPQRIVFAHAHAPLPPLDQLPAWPGPLQVRQPHVITGQHTVLDVTAEIAEEVRTGRYEVATGKRHLGPIDGHLTLSRLKIAGLLALLDERLLIGQEDWTLAGALIDSSVSVRKLLVEAKVSADRDRIATQGVANAAREIASEDFKLRHQINRAQRAVERAVLAHGPIKKKALRDKLSNDLTAAAVINPALEELVALGKIEETDEGWVARGGSGG